MLEANRARPHSRALMTTTPTETPRPAHDWRALLPTEHGVWAWLGLPLLLALLVAPGATTALGALATLAGLGTSLALGRLARRHAALVPALTAGSVAALATVGAWLAAPVPLAVALTLGVGGVLGVGVSVATGARPPRLVALEVAAIAAFVATGAGLAIAGGSTTGTVATRFVALFAWLVLGLWFVKGRLAVVLKRREPWRAGIVVGALAANGAALLGLTFGPLVAGLVPFGYALRVLAHRPVTSPREAKRVGLEELACGVIACLVLGLA